MTEQLTLQLVAAQQHAGIGKAATDADRKLTDERVRQMSEHMKDQIVRVLFCFLFLHINRIYRLCPGHIFVILYVYDLLENASFRDFTMKWVDLI